MTHHPAAENCKMVGTFSGDGPSFTVAAEGGRQDFASAFGTGAGNTFDVTIRHRSQDQWARCIAYMDDATTLVIVSTEEGSDGANDIDWLAGTKDLVNDNPAAAQVRHNQLGDAAYKDTGTTAGTVAAGDDSRIAGAVQNTGNETIAGTKTFSTIPVLPASNPTTNNQAARKAYVDSKGITQTTGAAPYYGARAWVKFDGTGTVSVLAAGNVTSITDNGTGDYTINFATAMPDAHYAVVAGATQSTGNQNCIMAIDDNNLPTASACRVNISQVLSRFDYGHMMFAFFR